MRRTGQWLRWIGLLFEMIGVIGVVHERGGQAVPQISIPGGPVFSSAWVAFALGFAIWVVGQILLLATARKPQR